MYRMLWIGLIAVGLALGLAIGAAPALRPTSQPASRQSGTSAPVKYHEDVRINPPLHVHVVTVDLTDPTVAIRVVRGGEDPDGDGPWQTKLQTVRAMAEREKLAVAVNANFFTGKDALNVMGKKIPYFTDNWGMVTGWAMSDGVLWANQPTGAAMVVDAKGAVSIGRFGRIPSDARQVVSSGELLVNHGRNTATSKDLAPRTAVGIDRTGRQLTMIVVDGRRDDFSVGMSAPQLADELIQRGCFDALGLDGGGSATMVMRDPSNGTIKLMNRPSDGHDLPIDLSIERPVADALGIAIGANATTRR